MQTPVLPGVSCYAEAIDGYLIEQSPHDPHWVGALSERRGGGGGRREEGKIVQLGRQRGNAKDRLYFAISLVDGAELRIRVRHRAGRSHGVFHPPLRPHSTRNQRSNKMM